MEADEFSFSLEAADNATKAALADDSVYFVQDGTDADKDSGLLVLLKKERDLLFRGRYGESE